MKCPECGGKGVVPCFGIDYSLDHAMCEKCHGKGIIEEPQEQTNEKWFCSLPIKIKAVYFARTQLGKGYWDKINRALHDEDFPEKEYVLKIITDWGNWLKEAHRE